MPIKSKTPVKTDLSALLEKLLAAEIEFILVGGLAAVVHGAPVTTMDVDIVHKQSSANIAKLMKFMKSVDAFHRRPDDKMLAPKKEDISGMGHTLLVTRWGPLDLLAMIEKQKKYEDLLEHTVEIEFRGYTLHVLDLKFIVGLKRHSGDLKDKLRLPILEDTLRQMMNE